MKNKELQEQLAKLDPELEIYGVHGASGCSYEVSYPSEHVKSEQDDIGPLCELPNGTKVITMSLD